MNMNGGWLGYLIVALMLVLGATAQDDTENDAVELEVLEAMNGLEHLDQPDCIVLAATDNEPTKRMLDLDQNVKCNNPEDSDWGECNCPGDWPCGRDGNSIDTYSYYCRQNEAVETADQFGDGLILGELEDPIVVISNTGNK